MQKLTLLTPRPAGQRDNNQLGLAEVLYPYVEAWQHEHPEEFFSSVKADPSR